MLYIYFCIDTCTFHTHTHKKMCLYIQKESLTAVMCSGLSLRRDVLKKWQVAFPAKIVCRHFDAASKRVRRSVVCNQWNSDVCVCDVGVSFGAFI
uniref:Uncharacterized protein n=1 Tax=Rhipicephalus appendiculatus TaxID=34631 RepID=A0A131YCK5_RHIAP